MMEPDVKPIRMNENTIVALTTPTGETVTISTVRAGDLYIEFDHERTKLSDVTNKQIKLSPQTD